ncbi:MAG: ATP-dependent RecD-like DNA helicase [Eubacteriales bacterium]|nr:ATP-dependent RecD-like DNA helicase [Eubacteriales bacterium]
MDETQKSLNGTVQAVLFQNEENGYTVLRLENDDGDPVTVVGCLPFASPGELLSLQGAWEHHPSHGLQFHAQVVRRSLPVGEKAIYDYLASRTIKGIGPATASLLVSRFGSHTLEILADHPEKLRDIRGIGERKAREISEAFRRQAGLRLLMEFLCSHGLRPEYAMRLYKLYGDGAMNLLRQNPYLLSSDRIGAAFSEADALALDLGFDGDSPERIAAAVIFEMQYNLRNGHSFLPKDKLIAASAQLIGVTEDAAAECLDILIDSGEVICDSVAGVHACYLDRLYEAECFVAERLRDMAETRLRCSVDPDEAADRLERLYGLRYAPLQREALRLAADRQLLVLTGGPGTGKTTIVRALLSIFDRMGLECFLAAPTGRAARRMTELTGREAATIHRLLGASHAADGDEPVFRRDENDPLECQALILDEASMVDIFLMRALLAALPPNARLILVGDADQLPSVGPGYVLGDILRSGIVASVRLTEIFRQGAESRIIRSAHAINHGQHPNLRENTGDFFLLNRTDSARASDTVIELCSTRLPNNMGIPPMDIQVLCPTRLYDTGSTALCRRLQAALNPPSPHKKEKVFGETIFREGDRVMQIKNNYDILWYRVLPLGAPTEGSAAGSGVYNGDVGQIARIDPENELLWVCYDDRWAAYDYEQLCELEPAYAMTVHKSQGSEYRAVILVIGRGSPRLMTRGLLYTAVTRARELLIIVGDEDSAHLMIDNHSPTRRYSGLRARLNGEC